MENVNLSYDDDEDVDVITCDVCNTKIGSDTHYRIHLTMAHHLKKEEELVAKGKVLKGRPLPKWMSYAHYLDYLELDEPIVGLAYVVQVQATPDAPGSGFRCRLCPFEGDMPSLTHHLISRKHRQKYLEAKRPDLATWGKGSYLSAKMVRAKAEVAERQDGRNVPEALKRPAAIRKTGALKVPDMKGRDRQPLAQGGPVRRPPQRRDRPQEERYGRGYPEPRPSKVFAPEEDWSAEQPRGRSLDWQKEERFYPHGHSHDLPPESYPANRYGERAGEGRGGAYEVEPRGGGAYADEPRRGGVYEHEERLGRAFEEASRGGSYEEEKRWGGAYQEDSRRGGVHEWDGMGDRSYRGEGMIDMPYGGEGLGGGAYEEEGRDRAVGPDPGRAERGRSSRWSSVQDVEGAPWPPVRGVPNDINQLPETFKRFLSGAAEKRRAPPSSQSAELSRESYKKPKLDPLNLGKVIGAGSDDVLNDLKNIRPESVEEANFRDKLCDLLIEFQANKSLREQAQRKSPSAFHRDYNHLSSQQLEPAAALSHGHDPGLDPPSHSGENLRDPLDHYIRGQRDSLSNYERQLGEPHDRYERDQRDPLDHYIRGQRDSLNNYERQLGEPQDRYERDQRDPPDHYIRGQRDSLSNYERELGEPHDRYERDQRDPPDHSERGPRDSKDRFERGRRDSKDQFDWGQRDSKDGFERSRRDEQGRYEEYGRRREDRYGPGSSGARHRATEGREDLRAGLRRSYEDVFGKAPPDAKQNPARRGMPPYPRSPSPPNVWPPQRRQPPAEFDPENSASLDKLTSTLLQLVAQKRGF